MEFNILKNFTAAKKLQDQLLGNGFTPAQTETILEGVMKIIEDGELVTKPFLRTALAELRTELQTDQAKLRAELQTDQAKLRAELRTELAQLRAEFVEKLAHSERKMIIWMIGLQLATWALLFAVFKN